MFVSHSDVFFGEMPVWVFSPLFDWVVCFSGMSCMSCLYILDINPLSVVSFAIIFSHSQGVFSPCLEFICCPKGFKFDWVPFVHFCFYFFCLGRLT